MALRQGDPCYWCGGPSVGRDHVFPAALFESPRPALITVPACEEHNAKLQKDEAYFRAFVLAQAYPKPAARRMWESRLRPELKRSPAFRKLLASQVREVSLYSPGGIYLGDVETLLAHEDRINRVLEKMVRGVYYADRGEVLGDVEFQCHLVSPMTTTRLPTDLVEAAGAMPPARQLGSAVTYRYGIALDNDRVSLWVLRFFGRALFVVGTFPPEFLGDDPADEPARSQE